jgi:hypothetical protein
MALCLGFRSKTTSNGKSNQMMSLCKGDMSLVMKHVFYTESVMINRDIQIIQIVTEIREGSAVADMQVFYQGEPVLPLHLKLSNLIW